MVKFNPARTKEIAKWEKKKLRMGILLLLNTYPSEYTYSI